MYPIELPYEWLVEPGVFLILSLMAMAFSFLAIISKDYVYSAMSLGVVGASVAGLFATLGYGYIATFHLLVYVGATVTFIVFSVVMMREVPEEYKELRPIGVIMGIILAVLLNALLVPRVPLLQPKPSPSLSELAGAISSRYWFPTLVLAVCLATVIIEGLVIARREKR